jgi:hypothetical protein
VAVSGSDPDDGREDESGGWMLRPETRVLGEEALVPDSNIVRPPPNHFTHRMRFDEPYRFDGTNPGADPDGVLLQGTPVALLVEDPKRSRVVDKMGLYVDVRPESLEELVTK